MGDAQAQKNAQDQEQSEIRAISDRYNVISICGQEVPIDYPMRAWRVIKTDFGGLEGITKSLNDDPIDFILERLSILIQIGLVDPDQVTLEEIQTEIDANNFTVLKDTILKKIMLALTGTLPDEKAGKKGNPQKAEK